MNDDESFQLKFHKFHITIIDRNPLAIQAGQVYLQYIQETYFPNMLLSEYITFIRCDFIQDYIVISVGYDRRLSIWLLKHDDESQKLKIKNGVNFHFL
jgi:hypothetical protein